MVDLKEFYNNRVNSLKDTEHLRHVGHTQNGKAISQNALENLLKTIAQQLDLTSNDHLLDLCCGNGLITKDLSRNCKNSVGIDLSENMIEIAQKYYADPKINYYVGDISELGKILPLNTKFTKVIIFGALQHFSKNDFPNLLDNILKVSTKEAKIVFGFIPNIKHKWTFYDSWKKRILYFWRKTTKTDVMGSWWDKNYLHEQCKKKGLTSTDIDISVGQYGYPYRFNLVIERT